MTHGDSQHAETIVAEIERRFGLPAGGVQHGRPRVRLRRRTHTSLTEVGRTLFQTYRQRTLGGITLMGAQAFFMQCDIFQICAGLDAAGNFLGPLLLGRPFDTVGRKIMIGLTYAVSGVLLAGVGFLFSKNLLSAGTLTVA